MLKAIGTAIGVVVAAIAAYKLAMFAISAAQKIWNIVQAIGLALQGPKGWAILAGAVVAGTVAIVGIVAAQESMNDQMAKSDENMGKASDAMGQLDAAGDDAADGMDKAHKSAKELTKDVQKLTERLKEQLATWGMTSEEAEVYKLKMQGVKDEELKEAYALAAQIDALKQREAERKKAEKAWEDEQKEAQKIIEEMRDPFEKLDDQLKLISKLEKDRLLTSEQAAKASEKAAEEAIKAMDKGKKVKEHEPKNYHDEKIGTIERRFTRGFTANSVPVLDKMYEEQKRQGDIARRQLRELEKKHGQPPSTMSLPR